jgi:hypothetical protein
MDGDCMGGTWKMGTWGRNIAFETLHVSMGICFRGSGCSGIERRARPLVEM